MDHAFWDMLEIFVQRIVAAGTSVSGKTSSDDRLDSLTVEDAPGCIVSILDVSAPQLDGVEDHDRREVYRVRIAVSPYVVLGAGAVRKLWQITAELKAALNGIDLVLKAQSFVPQAFSQMQKVATKRGDLAFHDMIFDVHVVLDEADHTTAI